MTHQCCRDRTHWGHCCGWKSWRITCVAGIGHIEDIVVADKAEDFVPWPIVLLSKLLDFLQLRRIYLLLDIIFLQRLYWVDEYISGRMLKPKQTRAEHFWMQPNIRGLLHLPSVLQMQSKPQLIYSVRHILKQCGGSRMFWCGSRSHFPCSCGSGSASKYF